MFKDANFELLRVIEFLKKTGMSLTDIKHFVEMSMQGDDTIDNKKHHRCPNHSSLDTNGVFLCLICERLL